LLSASRTKDKDLEEGTPDHPGEPLETAEVNGDSSESVARTASVARAPMPATADAADGQVVQAAMRQSGPVAAPGQPPSRENSNTSDSNLAPEKLPPTGTVVLDVEQGGIEVPSFVGKTVRGAVEAAQDAGLDLEAVGSGLGTCDGAVRALKLAPAVSPNPRRKLWLAEAAFCETENHGNRFDWIGDQFPAVDLEK
jgi:hypothetical protein